jgi:hypothetical protein
MTGTAFKRMTTQPFIFLYGKTETNFPGISEAGRGILEALEPFIEKNAVKITGPCVWACGWMQE